MQAVQRVLRVAPSLLLRGRPCPAFLSTSSTSKGDEFHRDITALESGLLERQQLESVDSSEMSSGGGDLMYQGEYFENWEELLEEAKASYPERGGKRRANCRRRYLHKMHLIANQHRVLKKQRIAKHEQEMLDRQKRAVERRGWLGPILTS
mmetsp:Transcript_13743/g.44835  ORF Transcript_13743/g.44835 Transcript_13743/m.44835 type:complete len:151 (+) Transcript_13743:41-493(+)